MRRLFEIAMDVLRVRDALEPIKAGVIQRGCASTKMGDLILEPGLRTTKLKDAQAIAVRQYKKLNDIGTELERIFREDGEILEACPTCGLPMLLDEQYVSFAVGVSPRRVLSLKLRAQWCAHPDCKTETVTIIPNKTGRL